MSGELNPDADELRCPSCAETTPPGHYCVRCGGTLDDDPQHVRARWQFAAAPGQRRLVPWLVSTLFPHLPHRSMRDFRIALVTGTAVVAVLAGLRLFGVAIIAAALLLPLITVLYFYDVDVYEGEPWWATAWTFAWGAASGVAVGLLANAVAPRGPALLDRGSTAHVLTGGVLLPALGVAAMLVGPLVLLALRRFNEVLDGATFGSATAATFAAAQAVVVGAGVLGDGLRPVGAALPWIVRLVTLAVATPVLAMAAIGVAVAAIWLRYRAPLADRNALGLAGHPAVAIATAVVLIIAGAIGETVLPVGAWLASVAALDLIALALLRRTIHLGLCEEAAEIEIGPPIVCANCGAQTARHTFCGHCGIALKALPKARDGYRGAAPGRLRAGRRHSHRWLVAFALAVLVLVGIGIAVAELAAPASRQPVCRPGVNCGAPPILSHDIVTFPGYTVWQSTGLGFALRFDHEIWQVSGQDADDVQLDTLDGSGLLVVEGRPASQLDPQQILADEVSTLGGKLLGFAADHSAADALLGTSVGLVPGPGGTYDGTASTPQAPQTPVIIELEAAVRNRVTILAWLLVAAGNQQAQQADEGFADDVIDSIQWAS
jgi:ribosomal protein L32